MPVEEGCRSLRQRLLSVPDVVKVNIYGIQDEKIYVEFSHARLAALGIPPQAIFDPWPGRTPWSRQA